ncbi:MAG: hypothetical protein HDS10_04700 [Bacteroides sp.]|nr:hypothetical protein [Bacteroides sp.]
MNKLSFIALLLAPIFWIMVTGCSTSEKLTITGTPGTVVYSPQKEPLGTINSDSKLRLKLDSDAYYGYLYTRNDSLDLWVPFGLNTRYDNHKATKLLGPVGSPLGLALGEGAAIGIGMSSLVGGLVTGIGIGLAGLVTPFLVQIERMDQVSYSYNFSYEPYQSTNQDIRLEKFIVPQIEEKNTTDSDHSQKQSNLKIDKSPVKANVSKTNKKGNRSKKSNLKITSGLDTYNGTYSCNGEILQDKRVVTLYKDISLVLTLLNSKEVEISIYIDSKTKVFDIPEVFVLNKTQSTKKSVVLTLKDNPACKIILSGKNISYFNPNVMIEDDIYILSLKGSKDQ